MEPETAAQNGAPVFGEEPAAPTREVDVYLVTLSTSGRPKKDGPSGVPQFGFQLSRPAQLELDATLEVYTPGQVKGRALLWRNGLPLTKPNPGDDARDMPLSAEETSSALELRDRQQLLAVLQREIARADKERDTLRDDIAKLKLERETELTRNQTMLARTFAATQTILDREADQLEKRHRDLWDTLNRTSEVRGRVMKALEEEAGTQLQLRTRLDEVAKRDMWGEALKMASEFFGSVAQSPVGDALAFQLALILAERAARKSGQAFSKDHALAEMMRGGKRFKASVDQLKAWSAVDNSPLRRTAALTLEVLFGGIELAQLEAYRAEVEK